MAYHSTTGMAANTLDMLPRLKSFLVDTCGWTLHDDQMALPQPYFVVASHGESGREDIYLQFFKDTYANMIAVRGALYWNPTTHTPVKEVYYSTVTDIMTRDDNSFLYWLYADLDHIFVVTRIVAYYYGHYTGIVKRFWSDQIALSLSPVSAGSNVTVPVDNASIFTAGLNYMILDKANIERARISSINTSSNPNTVTFATLANGYSAGAKIGEDPQPVIIGHTRCPGGGFYSLNRSDGYYGPTNHSGNTYSSAGGAHYYSDPDSRYGLVAMFPWFASLYGTGWEELRGELIEVYSIGSGAGASEDVIDLGTSTYKMFKLEDAGWCAVKE